MVSNVICTDIEVSERLMGGQYFSELAEVTVTESVMLHRKLFKILI